MIIQVTNFLSDVITPAPKSLGRYTIVLWWGWGWGRGNGVWGMEKGLWKKWGGGGVRGGCMGDRGGKLLPSVSFQGVVADPFPI